MDDVVTLRLGEMGFILSRKLIANIFAITLCACVLIWKINHAVNGAHSHKYGHSHEHDVSKQSLTFCLD